MDPSPKPAGLELLPPSVASLSLPSHVTVARTTLTLKDICQLSPGAVVDFAQPASEPAELVVNGKVLARGTLVAVQGNYGLKVSALCPR